MTVDTSRPVRDVAPIAVRAAAVSAGRRTPRGAGTATDETTGGLVSTAEWRDRRVAVAVRSLQRLLLLLLLLWGLFPMLWLAKASITPTREILSEPMAPWPEDAAWSNLTAAWRDMELSRYLGNTVVLSTGSLVMQLVVATTVAYGLSVLRPFYAKAVNAVIVATLFLPSVVLLVPLYVTILDVPFTHWRLLDSYWAVWLPAGANAFNVVLVKRFFDNLPREVFEAARVDGAGPLALFWHVVLPMSKPVLGVVSVFAFVLAWKDFLWPLIVLRDPDVQPISVRLPTVAPFTDLGVFNAALFLSTLVPVALFLVFQRQFLRGTGISGAVKG